jgi:hypothetical protein
VEVITMSEVSIHRDTTLTGPTISYTVENTTLSMTVNSGGIYLEDGAGEIPIEIGENGLEGNTPYVSDVESISDRELDLIFEIAKYQYRNFKQLEGEC